MRIVSAAVAVIVMGVAAAVAVAEDRATLDWKPWRSLPVQDGGRQKALDTLARETLRLLGNQSRFTDPETAEVLDPVALYLSMLFDWQGWDHSQKDRLLMLENWRPQYFRLHPSDKWDSAPLLRVDHLELRAILGLEANQKYVSPDALSTTLVEDPRTGKQLSFAVWGEQLLKLEDEGTALSLLETKALELAGCFWAYQDLRMGRGLAVLPIPNSPTKEWQPIAHLLLTDFNDTNDPDSRYRQVQQQLRQVREAYRQRDPETFKRSTAEFLAAVRPLGTELGEYPTPWGIGLEISYNHWRPFRFAWALTLTAFVALLLHLLGSHWKFLYITAVTAYVAGLVAMLIGFGFRIALTGRPPVTNMYESVVYFALGVAILGLLFEAIYRRKFILAAAAAVATVGLVLADTCPSVLDPNLRPLEPVLRNNFWLIMHVMTITLSYAAFGLAVGIANITLGYYLVRSANQTTIAALTRFTYRSLQVGVLLLAIGTILGGVWADYSWGRFWGWDPKEVWALVALLGYLCVLHARFADWVGQRGLAALSVLCFSLVIMAWYGVNFILGAGLHSYGFGDGGQEWVYTAVAIQLLFTGICLGRSRPQTSPRGRSEQETEADQEALLAVSGVPSSLE